MLMRSEHFLGMTQCRVVILYWRFGTTYRSHLQGHRVLILYRRFGTTYRPHLQGSRSPLLDPSSRALSGNPLPTFRDNVSVPSSRVKKSTSWPLQMGPIRCPETSVKDYNSPLIYTPDECRSQLVYFILSLSITDVMVGACGYRLSKRWSCRVRENDKRYIL
jgi:hypothetical protein